MYRFVHLLRKFAKNKKVNVKDCKIWVAQSFDLPKELPKAKKDIFYCCCSINIMQYCYTGAKFCGVQFLFTLSTVPEVFRCL